MRFLGRRQRRGRGRGPDNHVGFSLDASYRQVRAGLWQCPDAEGKNSPEAAGAGPQKYLPLASGAAGSRTRASSRVITPSLMSEYSSPSLPPWFDSIINQLVD